MSAENKNGAAAPQPIIQVRDLCKAFGGHEVLKHISVDIQQGDVVCVIGPSGSGKSTFLRCLNRLEEPTGGEIIFDGVNICDPKTDIDKHRQRMGMVFQQFNLFPHMNIMRNLTLAPTKLQGLKEEEAKEHALDLLRKVGLADRADSYPSQLSGGQQQRIAIARALVNEPEILLLDEPLGALDLKMRKEMQLELKEMHDRLGITFIYVTHDQEEALTMSDTIVVMSEGRIQQIGTPEMIYNEPKNAFVADFIGESNIFNGIMTGKLKARFSGGEFECVDDIPEGTHITAVVRPEDVIITAPADGTIRGTVTSVIFKGMHYEITVESGKSEMVIQSVHSAKVGDYVGMKVDPDNIHIMIAEDHTNYFTVDINENFRLEFNGKPLDTSVTKIIKGSRRNEDGTLVDANGEPIDPVRTRIVAAIEPQDIKMTDHVEEGLVDGYISNLIYKGDHYSYVIRTELEQDFIVDDEYLWNMDDHVGLIMPVEKMNFRVKK